MITANKLIFRCLDTNGDGTGTTNAVGDYSLAAEEFFITPGTNQSYSIARIIISIEDTSGMSATEYGNLGAALTNGITVNVDDGAGNQLVDLSGGIIIKSNSHWGALCYDVDLKTWGVGNELLVARWSYFRSGSPIMLKQNHRLVFTLNDSFTGLVAHTFFAQGHRI